MNFKQAALEGVKEFWRVMLAALIVGIPAIYTQLEATGTIDWRGVALVSLIAGLKAIDKLVHKWNGTQLNGIAPF